MSMAGILMFMEKLKQLINSNNNPEIIISERPKFQLLYDDLASMIQILGFIHHLEKVKVNDLKQRFICAAEEAQYTVDLFLSYVHIRNNGNLPTSLDDVKTVLSLFLSCVHIRKHRNLEDVWRSVAVELPTSEVDSNPSLNLDDIRRSFKSIQVEFTTINTDSSLIQSAPAPAPVPFSRSHSVGSNTLLDEIVVGLDHDVELIRDKLVEDHKKLAVVSIVGMGGIGKTTLATKVFKDRFIMHHFYVRAWVTVSQTYDKRAVLIQILESIGVKLGLGLEEASDSRLRELVHKKLLGQRYLIVIDDIWHIETWDNLKLFFPHDNNGSRILLTSRITEVTKHAYSDGFVHHLGYLNKERSWELLCKRVFYGNECPEWSIKSGMQIVQNCQGLPLAVLVIAGVLAKEAWNWNLWMEIAERTGSYIVSEENGCLEALGLSYSHLPLHLRECFLYLGGFPEDHKFEVQRLIWLWVAEGFIEEDGNRSLEDIAEGYLMDLIDRNLVNVAKREKSNGGVKTCKVHDLVRELCLRKSKEEGFILETERLVSSSNVVTPPYKSVHMFTNTNDPFLTHSSTQNLRSVLCFSDVRSLSDDIAKYFRSFMLLRVLDLQNCELRNFPKGVELLVHLRFLAIWCSSKYFPSSVCNLWNLQTLTYINTTGSPVYLPSNISDLVNLRHLWGSLFTHFVLNSIEKPMNLQTISCWCLEVKVHGFQKYFPCIKKLSCFYVNNKQNDFKSFTHLESLTINGSHINKLMKLAFPATLKTLELVRCNLPWSDMSIIQSLPHLQVLELGRNAFKGSCWNTSEQEFPQLKFLGLNWLNIKVWEAFSTSFPCLRQLKVNTCHDLEEIPLEIGDIPTLELIEIYKCRHSVDESVRRIQQEQQDMMGNYDLKIEVTPSEA